MSGGAAAAITSICILPGQLDLLAASANGSVDRWSALNSLMVMTKDDASGRNVNSEVHEIM